MTLLCEYCGASFSRRGKNASSAKFCSRTCRSAASNAHDVNCVVCGKKFRTSREAKFCSMPCKGIASRKVFKCQECGTDSYGFQNRNKKWCSRECASKHRRTGTESACGFCGKSIYVSKSRADKYYAKVFCSAKCHNSYQGRNKTKHVCKVCGDTFTWSPSREKSYNVTYCSISCKSADPEWARRLCEFRQRQQRGKETSAERLGYAILDTIGVEYIRQPVFGGKFTPDAAIPSARLIVQFDGDYWHDRKGTSSEPGILKRVALDKSQDSYARASGWEVVRLWESDLKHRPAECASRVSQLLFRPLSDASERDPLALS